MVGKNIFSAAKTNDYASILKYLTEYDNLVDEKNDASVTCLHIAASMGHVEAAKVLVEFGANVHAIDNENHWTPLHRAIYFQQVKMVLFLISIGANCYEYYDKEGFSPIDLYSTCYPTTNYTSNQKQNSIHIRKDQYDHDGVMVVFGKSDFHLGIPLSKSSLSLSKPRRLDLLLDQNITSTLAANHHSFAVTNLGEVFVWGYGKGGKLGLGHDIIQPEPVLLTALQRVIVTQIAASEAHTLALNNHGQVWSWGCDSFGQLGHGTNPVDHLTTPRRIDSLRREHMKCIAVGETHSLCLSNENVLYGWGSNKHGQIALKKHETVPLNPHTTGCSTSLPRRIAVPTPSNSTDSTSNVVIQKIVASYNSTLLLLTHNHSHHKKVSEVYQWGDGTYFPRRVPFQQNKLRSRSHDGASLSEDNCYYAASSGRELIHDLAAGRHHFVGLSTMGKVYTWGLGADQLGHGHGSEQSSGTNSSINKHVSYIPQVVEGLLPEHGGIVISISAAGDRTCAVTTKGDLFTWGTTGDKGLLSTNSAVNYQPVPQRIQGIKRAWQVSAAEDHTFVIIQSTRPAAAATVGGHVNVMSPQQQLRRQERRMEGWSDSAEDDEDEETEEVRLVTSTVTKEASEEGAELSTSSAAAAITVNVPGDNAYDEYNKGGIGNNNKMIPSLKSLCQQVVLPSINYKNVLPALIFAETYSAMSLAEYCYEFIQLNLDAMLVQYKAPDFDKIVQEWQLPNTTNMMMMMAGHCMKATTSSTDGGSNKRREERSLSLSLQQKDTHQTAGHSNNKKPQQSQVTVSSSKKTMMASSLPSSLSTAASTPSTPAAATKRSTSYGRDLNELSVNDSKEKEKATSTASTSSTSAIQILEIRDVEVLQKMIRATKKKMQAIDELQKRIDEEKYHPTEEQTQKLNKMKELTMELMKLEKHRDRLQAVMTTSNISATSPSPSPASSTEKKKKDDSSAVLPQPQQAMTSTEQRSPMMTMSPMVITPSQWQMMIGGGAVDTQTLQSLQADEATNKQQDEVKMTEKQQQMMMEDKVEEFVTPVKRHHKNKAAGQQKYLPLSSSGEKSPPCSSATSVSISSMAANGRSVLSPAIVSTNTASATTSSSSSSVVAVKTAWNQVTPPPFSVVSSFSSIQQQQQDDLASSKNYQTSFNLEDLIGIKKSQQKHKGHNSGNKAETVMAPSVVIQPVTVPVAVTPVAVTAKPSPWSKASVPVTSSVADKTTTVVSSSPSSASVSSTPMKKSLAEIVAEEEYNRQHSSTCTMQLKGNDIRWHIERKPRAESFEKLVQRELKQKKQAEEEQRIILLVQQQQQREQEEKEAAAEEEKRRQLQEKKKKQRQKQQQQRDQQRKKDKLQQEQESLVRDSKDGQK